MPEELYDELKAKYENYLEADFKDKNKRKMKSKIFSITHKLVYMVISISVFVYAIHVIEKQRYVPLEPIKTIIIPIVLILLVIVSTIISIIQFRKKNRRVVYESKYYETVVRDLVSFLYTDVVFSDKEEFDFRNTFYNSGFNRRIDDKHINSEWSMHYGAHTLYLYDVILYEVSNDSDGGTTSELVFKGLFGVMSLSQSINDDIYINKIGLKADKPIEEVNIDSADFQKIYRVFASNKVKAMQLLTHDVMDKIIEYSEQYKTDFEFRIIDDKLYFRIFNENTFSNQSKESISRVELENDYHNLTLFKDITDIVEKSAYDNGLFS